MKITHLVLGSILLFLTTCSEKQSTQIPPIKVPVIQVAPEDIQVKLDFVGQTFGKNDIDIRARVTGFLDAIHFREGSQVKKGDLLYEIDPQPFEAKVAQQEGMLAQARTNLARTESDLRRIRPLAEKNAVSQRELDAAVASRDAAVAEVDAATAAVRLANIELGYTRITAPISGIIGKSQAEVSDLVGQYPNTVLNTISETDSIRVQFFITEAQYLDLAQERRKEEHAEDEPVPLELVLADGSVHSDKGKVDFINRQIDTSTGTILLQATFANPDGYIRPGQSVKVRASVYTIANGIMIPQRCITEVQGRYYVSVFKDDNTLENRAIQTGQKKGNMWLVSEGLEEGDLVVLENVNTRGMDVQLEPDIQQFDLIE